MCLLNMSVHVGVLVSVDKQTEVSADKQTDVSADDGPSWASCWALLLGSITTNVTSVIEGEAHRQICLSLLCALNVYGVQSVYRTSISHITAGR